MASFKMTPTLHTNTTCTAAQLLANVFVVTLPSSARNAAVSASCTQAGLRCVLGFGVEKATLDVAALRREAEAAARPGPDVPRASLSAGEFACSLAHRNVYDHLLLNQIACGVVLENDAILGSGFAALLGATPLPPFDVLKLTLGTSFKPYDGVLRKLRAGGGAPVVKDGLGGWTTTAYAISLEGARRLRQLQTPVFTVSDGLLNFAAHQSPRHREAMRGAGEAPPPLRASHLVPPLAWQADGRTGESEIGEHAADVKQVERLLRERVAAAASGASGDGAPLPTAAEEVDALWERVRANNTQRHRASFDEALRRVRAESEGAGGGRMEVTEVRVDLRAF